MPPLSSVSLPPAACVRPGRPDHGAVFDAMPRSGRRQRALGPSLWAPPFGFSAAPRVAPGPLPVAVWPMVALSGTEEPRPILTRSPASVGSDWLLAAAPTGNAVPCGVSRSRLGCQS